MLVPVPEQESTMERWRRQGDVIPATIFDDFDEPLPSVASELPSARLARLRADER